MAKVYNVDSSFDFGLFDGSSCAFGVFDGVHKGHRFLLACARETARENNGASIALTFDIDPDEVFRPSHLKKLMTNEDRIAALAASGVDYVVVLPFTRRFASQSPEDFLAATFGGYAPYALHVGADFHFGKCASGDVSDLMSWAQSRLARIYAHDLESMEGAAITATRIRGLLSDGHCAEANDLLGHPYTFAGVVQPGRGQGSDMGFSTANLCIPPMLRALGDGVYAAWATIGDSRWKAAISVGVSRVFDDAVATCEVHILDFSDDIYGETITVEPVCFLRPMIKFDSVDELIATVKGNIEWVREHL